MNPPPLNVPQVDIFPYFTIGVAWVFQFFPNFIEFIKSFIGFLIGLSMVLAVSFLLVIIYCVERMKVLKKQDEEIYDNPVVPIVETAPSGDAAMAKRWESVKTHIQSANPNDWRQAIIDADIILDSLLSRLGYRGESVGEKLKRAHIGDFATLDDAWAAHKMRNQVAHQGTGHVLNQLEAKETIDHYRKVFQEFYFIP